MEESTGRSSSRDLGNARIRRPLNCQSNALIVQTFSNSAHQLSSACRNRYGGEHRAPELQKEAVYGLTELHREEVRKARLVANPGCYPTTVQLPLCPLLEVTQAAGLAVSDMHSFLSCIHHGTCRGAAALVLFLITLCLQQSLCKIRAHHHDDHSGSLPSAHSLSTG